MWLSALVRRVTAAVATTTTTTTTITGIRGAADAADVTRTAAAAAAEAARVTRDDIHEWRDEARRVASAAGVPSKAARSVLREDVLRIRKQMRQAVSARRHAEHLEQRGVVAYDRRQRDVHRLRGGWRPAKQLSRATMDRIRFLRREFPNEHTPRALAEMFGVSADAVRRILHSRWQPTEEAAARQQRRHDEQVIAAMAERMRTDESFVPPPQVIARVFSGAGAGAARTSDVDGARSRAGRTPVAAASSAPGSVAESDGGGTGRSLEEDRATLRRLLAERVPQVVEAERRAQAERAAAAAAGDRHRREHSPPGAGDERRGGRLQYKSVRYVPTGDADDAVVASRGRGGADRGDRARPAGTSAADAEVADPLRKPQRQRARSASPATAKPRADATLLNSLSASAIMARFHGGARTPPAST